LKQSPLQENSNKNSPKILIIIFGVIIGIFSITALAISIYILIKLSTSTTALG
jgi:flagellar basal body-associated protein FliL